MTVLVTGATGLVGTRLLPRLTGAGIDCRALVRKRKEPVAGVDYIEGNMLDEQSLVKAVDGVTAIIHLAAVFRTQDTDLIWKSNLEGARNLIAATKAHAPSSRFIMASTGLVYNSNGSRPACEDDDASPTLAYPASKLAAENLLRESGLQWSILRLPFIYGDKDGHLEMLPKIAQNMGWHPAMKMSVAHHRDIETAMKLALSGVMDGRVVNIRDDAPTSIYELTRLVGERLEPTSEPLVNPWHGHMDVSLAHSLGFQPTVRTIHQAVHEGLL
ncbi:MAG: NAD(P)-dependent oxidoreductase [Candidatus Obscuribacterales bacterium]|nr:NAD(P)-dependent oxidoreductase [Candidatus Obscuribacterales bacterium]